MTPEVPLGAACIPYLCVAYAGEVHLLTTKSAVNPWL